MFGSKRIFVVYGWALTAALLAACGAAQPGPLAGIHTPLHLRDRASRLLRNALKSKK